MSRWKQSRLAVYFGIDIAALWATITHMFSDVRPFDWLMLIIEVLVLVLIAYEVSVNLWHKRRIKSRLATILVLKNKGQELQVSVPHGTDDTAISAWNDAVKAWANDANRLLSTFSPQASATFLHEPGGPLLDYYRVPMNARDHYQFLLTRLNNLHSIMEKPDVYF